MRMLWEKVGCWAQEGEQRLLGYMKIREADGGGSGAYHVVLGSQDLSVLGFAWLQLWFFYSPSWDNAMVPSRDHNLETGDRLILGDSAFLECEEHLCCPHQAKTISACPLVVANPPDNLNHRERQSTETIQLVLGQPTSFLTQRICGEHWRPC